MHESAVKLEPLDALLLLVIIGINCLVRCCKLWLF